MKILKFTSRMWDLVGRLARVIVELDDLLIEAKAFWDWLLRNEPVEPEENNE